MSKNKPIILLSAILTVALAGWFSGVFYSQKNSMADYGDWLTQRDEMAEENRKSVIIRRVSEQLEKIAYQQKDISEQRLRESEKQKTEAERMRRVAETETRKALEARSISIQAYHDMEKQKQLAERRREEAHVARMEADTLAALALGRSLGTLAVTHYRAGKHELAKLLGYHAWEYTSRNNGDCYQPAILSALTLVSGLSGSFFAHKGNIKDIAFMDTGGSRLVSISNRGEIIVWNKNQKEWIPRELFVNENYDFRHMETDRKGTIYVISACGQLIVLKENNHEEVMIVNLKREKARAIVMRGSIPTLLFDNGDIIRMGKDQREWYLFYHHPKKVTAACGEDDQLFFSDTSGAIFQLDKEGQPAEKIIPQGEGKITSLTVTSEWIIAGYREGKIVLNHRERKEQTILSGHQTAITDMACTGKYLITTGYDRCLNLWNLQSNHPEPVELATYNDWIFCIAVADNGHLLICGGASRALHTSSISPEYMAMELKKSLKREFTEEEYSYYIGKSKKEAGK